MWRVLLCLLLCSSAAFGQQNSPYYKWGKVTDADLKRTVYPVDSSAQAVVLADFCDRAIEGNTKGWFSVVTKRHRLVHILNKNAYDKADVSVPLYKNGDDEERLDKVRAVTYTLENGKVVTTEMEKAAILTDKASKNMTVKKFTLPNIKEGCIIEYEYKVTSDFISNLDTWYFQEDIPVLWSECDLSLPQFYMYSFLGHGYRNFDIMDKKDRNTNFSVVDTRGAGSSQRVNFVSGVTDYRWIMKNVPELKKERFSSARKNHVSSMDFQLIATREPLTQHDYRTSWSTITKNLREASYFAGDLQNGNGWLNDDLREVSDKYSTKLEKAISIFNYVRDNYTCTDDEALYIQQPLKAIAKAKKGNVAEINLLLTAMLRHEGISADPVILSTREHGYSQISFPMLSNFNYVICQASIGEQVFYLDASRARLSFNQLPSECYNGDAVVIDEFATPVILSADSVKDQTLTSIFINNDEKGQWRGSYRKTYGKFGSYDIREEIVKSGKDAYIKEKQKEMPEVIKLTNAGFDSLTKLAQPVALHADLKFEEQGDDDVIYLNPLFGEQTTENPFKAAERFYPVEMPFAMDETVIATIEVPKGYVIDELPKQVVAKLDEDNSAFFEYRISQSNGTISLRTRTTISRTLFMPDEYQTLRDFFALIVKKQGEQIVFKKKK